MNAPAALSILDDDTLRSQIGEFAQMAAEGDTARKTWAAIEAGRRLHELKNRCQHGEFAAAKSSDGFKLSESTAWRYMTLASSPVFSGAESLDQIKGLLIDNEWKSLKKVYDAHQLVKDRQKAAPSSTIDDAEPVDLCRFSGSYLIRLTLEGQRHLTGPRVEVSLETDQPQEAVWRRDFLFRVFDKMSLLTDRSRSKWEAYKAATDEGLPPVTASADSPVQKALRSLVQEIEGLNLGDELGESFSNALAITNQ